MEYKKFPNVVEFGKYVSDRFEWHKRANNEDFVAIKNGSDDWIQKLCWHAHNDTLPDDIRYEMIAEACTGLENHGLDYLPEAAVSTGELTQWLASSNSRLDYLQMAIEEMASFDDQTAFDLLQSAHFNEKLEVLNSVLGFFCEHCEE